MGVDFPAKQAWYDEISAASFFFLQAEGSGHILLSQDRSSVPKQRVWSGLIFIQVKDVLLSLCSNPGLPVNVLVSDAPFASTPLSSSACAKDLGTGKGFLLPLQPLKYTINTSAIIGSKLSPSGCVPKQSGK